MSAAAVAVTEEVCICVCVLVLLTSYAPLSHKWCWGMKQMRGNGMHYKDSWDAAAVPHALQAAVKATDVYPACTK